MVNIYEPLTQPWHGRIHKTATALADPRRDVFEEPEKVEPRDAPKLPFEKPKPEKRKDGLELLRKGSRRTERVHLK